MTRSRFLRSFFLASFGLALLASLAGCSNDSTTSAQFTASSTAPAPGLVKLEQKARSGSRVIVDVLVYGPEPALDLFGFKFGIRIGDSGLVKLVPQPSYAQTALLADAGQTIAIDVDGSSDASLVQVVIAKEGGGAGNGIAAVSAVVLELSFDVQGSGATTLTLAGLGNELPQAVDSTRASIAAVSFDAAGASVRGVTTGGSGY
jgi:hypothetical protein